MKSHNLIPTEASQGGSLTVELMTYPVIVSIPLVAYLIFSPVLTGLDPTLVALSYMISTAAWAGVLAPRGKALMNSLLSLGFMLSVYSIFFAFQSSPLAIGDAEPTTLLARMFGVTGPAMVLSAVMLRAPYTSAVTWATLALMTACSGAFVLVGAWNAAIGFDQLASGAYWLSTFAFAAAMVCTIMSFTRDTKAHLRAFQVPFGR